jgi:sterol desaturase/sphingolipid hydroxylase (fatty acid hydroxylase superfamily)
LTVPGLPAYLALAAVAAILAEVAWSGWRDRRVHDLRESLSNLAMMVVNRLLRPLALAWGVVVLSLFEQLQQFRLPEAGWAFLLTFLITDFAYYWYHRLSHELPLLWAMHCTHHSSPWLNLTTAMRLNWVAKFVGPLFFAPLVLLGMSPASVIAALALGLAWQFFLHTEAIGRLGWLEGKLLNTPSAHRVHHGRNAQYIDKNFAGALIVWDRLFGTYEPELEPVRYGVTSGFAGHNPLVIQFLPLWKYIRGEWRAEKALAAARREAQSGAD